MTVLLIFVLPFVGELRADDARPKSEPKIELRRVSPAPIQGLAIVPEMPIENRPEGDAASIYIHLRGEYPNEFASLLSGLNRAKQPGDGSFDLPILVTGPTTPFTILSIDPYGVTERAQYELDFPNWRAYNADVQERRRNEISGIPNPLSFSLGISQISYSETAVADYSSTVLTAKGSFIRPTPFRRWNIGVGGFFSLVPIQESAPESVRFLGINARLGYSLIPNPTIWRAGIYFGAYYTTMFVKANRFGFNDMSGPQIFPVVRRVFSRGRSASVYLKFAPLVSNASVVTLSSREIAAGGEYVFDFNGGKSHSIQFDYSNLNVVFPNQVISVKTISISTSYAL